MASKRPVIVSSKCGCAPDLAGDGKAGWVFEPGNSGDLKIKTLVQNILEDRSVLNGKGEQAGQKIQAYTYPAAIESINKIMKKVTADKLRSR
jgi:glycosyltransferase involved in cell wall biosynthesis